MKISLVGKKAWVGGATAGIGKAIAHQLAACGAEIILVARNEKKLQKTAAELDISYQQQHRYIISDYLDHQGHIEKITGFFSQNSIDILVNNTQGTEGGNLFQKESADYQKAFDLLFQTAVETTRLALPHMQAQGFGRIINVSSMTVKEPQDNLVLSNTMRAALVSWSKSLSNAVAKDGITVNSIMTGFFDTDRLNQLMKTQAESTGSSFEEIKKQRISAIPAGRLGKPEEYGFLVAFLASEYSAFLTGTSLPLDGGIASTLF